MSRGAAEDSYAAPRLTASVTGLRRRALLTESVAIDDSQYDRRQLVVFFRGCPNDGTNLRHIEIFQLSVDRVHQQSLRHGLREHFRAGDQLRPEFHDTVDCDSRR